ncbi:sialidase family protein [Paraburkholderia fungorum]|uniref:sialidase family protein n=1 Tax=Paraburkholderia fungorum TaxID=134537 RepID=UPI0038BCFAB9
MTLIARRFAAPSASLISGACLLGLVLIRPLAAAAASEAQPGVAIAHSPAVSRIFLGSPSLAILPNGVYVAAHDTFGPGSTQNTETVYESRDAGKSWHKISELQGQYWSSLFINRGALYIVGTSGFSGVPTIRRSLDGGRTWTIPRDSDTGILAAGGKYFSAAVPVVVANGRIWRTMERVESTGIWVMMMSAPVESDLLNAENWTFSNRLAPNSSWLEGKFGGWLEGNAVAKPNGEVVDVLRVYYNALPEKAAIAPVSADGTALTFDAQNGFVDMPGGGKKFTIRYDPRTKRYWSLTNAVPGSYGGRNYERARNTLALISSPDLRDWSVQRIVLHHPDWNTHGFQYVDWQFDGDDIVAVVRTSDDDPEGGAHSQHDSNWIKFNRISRFRENTEGK